MVASGTVQEGESVVLDTTAVLFARRDDQPRARHAWEIRTELRQRAGRGAWTAFDVVFLAGLFGIFMLNMLDITITLVYTSQQGWVAEGNALIRALAEGGGAITAVVFKVILITTAMLIMWLLYRKTAVAVATARSSIQHRRARFVLRAQLVATTFLFALYVWIVQHNARIVWF